MAKKITVKAGGAEVQVSDDLNKLVEDLLSKALPETKKALEAELERVYDNAVKNWPVRMNRPFTERDKFYAQIAKERKLGKSKKQAYAIAASMKERGTLPPPRPFTPTVSKESKNSRGKLRRGIRIESGEIVAFVENDAEYAWAIRAARDSVGNVPYKKRVSNELLWKPIWKSSDKIAKKLAEDLTRSIK